MRGAVTVVTVVIAGAGIGGCAGSPGRPAPSPTVPSPTVPSPSLLSLSCADSVGQQGSGHERVIGGVEGLVLPGSGDPASLYPIGEPGNGERYYVYKAFLAVSASAAPFATVSVTRPASARLVYGSPDRMGGLFSTDSGQPLIAAARGQVRLPVCGPRFTGFTGGVIVTRPSCVTFEVSSPSGRTASVAVPIGTASCPS